MTIESDILHTQLEMKRDAVRNDADDVRCEASCVHSVMNQFVLGCVV